MNIRFCPPPLMIMLRSHQAQHRERARAAQEQQGQREQKSAAVTLLSRVAISRLTPLGPLLSLLSDLFCSTTASSTSWRVAASCAAGSAAATLDEWASEWVLTLLSLCAALLCLCHHFPPRRRSVVRSFSSPSSAQSSSRARHDAEAIGCSLELDADDCLRDRHQSSRSGGLSRRARLNRAAAV